MTKVLIICGPTATGKTRLAVALAKRFGGELVSADSRQLYRGLDIISGKDIAPGAVFEPKLTLAIRGRDYTLGTYAIDGVPVWLYDLAEPDEAFSISHYRQAAEKVIADIAGRGKLPIIVGGSGLYIDAVVNPPDTIDVPVDTASRGRWETRSVEQLQEELRAVSPERLMAMNASDAANPRRLIRALEVARWKGDNAMKAPVKPSYDALWIGLRGNDVSARSIGDRVKERWEQGAVEEVKRLQERQPDRQIVSSLGVAPLLAFVAGEISREEAIEAWAADEIAYAKRQMTWFKTRPAISWHDPGKHDTYKEVEKQVSQWYT